MTAARSAKGRATSEKKIRQPIKQPDLLFDMDLAHRHQLFPSNPWNVRAAIEAFGPLLFPTWPEIPAETVVYEVCAGLGHMVAPLREYFPDVRPSDIHDWGKGFPVADAMTFEADSAPKDSIMMTNPPFDGELGQMAEKIVRQAQKTCDNVIVIQRPGFICGAGRFDLHHNNPIGNLKTFMPCTDRTPMRLGFYDPKADGPQEYAWFHYQRGFTGHYTGINLPPKAREKYFRPEDVRI